MANRPAIFHQVDVTRAIKGARAAGLAVGRVDIDREGRIAIFAKGEHASAGLANAWDEVLTDAEKE